MHPTHDGREQSRVRLILRRFKLVEGLTNPTNPGWSQTLPCRITEWLPVIRPQYAGKLQVKLPPDIFADPNGASIQRMRAGGVAREKERDRDVDGT
jgi:hypothetical protein